MKLSLNTIEVQDAIAKHIIASGFPVDMTNAQYHLSDEGCDITFETVIAEDKPKATRKPKKAIIEKPEEVIEQEEEEDTVETTSDMVMETLDESVEEEEVVEETKGTTNDFSLFG